MIDGLSIVALIVSAFAFVGFKLFKAAKGLQFEKIRFVSKKTTLSGISINLIFPIKNNEDTTLPFDGFDGGLFYGIHKLATITMPKGSDIDAKKTVEHAIEIRILFLELFVEIISIVKTGDFLNAATIEGDIKSMGLKFSQKQKINFA